MKAFSFIEISREFILITLFEISELSVNEKLISTIIAVYSTKLSNLFKMCNFLQSLPKSNPNAEV